MLTLSLEQNVKTNLLEKKLKILNVGTKIFLIENEKPIGIAELIFDREVELVSFGIDRDFDNFYNRQFFFRGILYKLGQAGLRLKIKTEESIIDKYGFVSENEYKIIDCKNAIYPSTCGCNK